MTVSSKHQRQLDEEAYVVIPEVLSVAEIASYRARLLELAAAERADGSGGCTAKDAASTCAGW